MAFPKSSLKKVHYVAHALGGLSARATTDNDVQVEVPLSCVRAGIFMPTGALPGYFVLFGQRIEMTDGGKFPLVFLHEDQAINHQLLFQMLSDACVKFKCHMIFAKKEATGASRSSGADGAWVDLFLFLRHSHIGVRMVPAPSPGDVEYGKALLSDYLADEALQLPAITKTTLLSQLMTMHEDIPDALVKKLYAFHAMRYLLAGMVKYSTASQIPVGSHISSSASIAHVFANQGVARPVSSFNGMGGAPGNGRKDPGGWT